MEPEDSKGFVLWRNKEYGGFHTKADDIEYTEPYYAIPLDPDGPMPGKRMLWKGQGVEVEEPRSFSTDGSVRTWWINAGTPCWAPAGELSPIPAKKRFRAWGDLIVEATDREELGRILFEALMRHAAEAVEMDDG